MAKKTNKKHPDRFRAFSPVFACFQPFCTFSLVFALFGLSVSDLFWPTVFALFRTIRLLPFSGCHLDSPEFSPTYVLACLRSVLCHDAVSLTGLSNMNVLFDQFWLPIFDLLKWRRA